MVRRKPGPTRQVDREITRRIGGGIHQPEGSKRHCPQSVGLSEHQKAQRIQAFLSADDYWFATKRSGGVVRAQQSVALRPLRSVRENVHTLAVGRDIEALGRGVEGAAAGQLLIGDEPTADKTRASVEI